MSTFDMSTLQPSKKELLSGTLDLLVLKTLDTMGPLHGYGIARRIEQMSANVMRLSQGSIYPPSSVSSSAAGSKRSGACPRRTAR